MNCLSYWFVIFPYIIMHIMHLIKCFLIVLLFPVLFFCLFLLFHIFTCHFYIEYKACNASNWNSIIIYVIFTCNIMHVIHSIKFISMLLSCVCFLNAYKMKYVQLKLGGLQLFNSIKKYIFLFVIVGPSLDKTQPTCKKRRRSKLDPYFFWLSICF